MHRLFSAALLSFAIVSFPGCGGKDAADNTSPTPDAASSQGATAPAPSTAAAAAYDTPQAAFEAFAKAMKSKDWKAATAVMSPESQSTMAAGMMMGAYFMTIQDEEKQKDLEQLLQKHGVNMEEASSPDDEAAGPEALTRPIKDLPAFIAEVAAWMEKNGNESDTAMADVGELSEVTIDGESATATVNTDTGPQPIEFRRIGAGWLIHLPTEGAEMEPDELDPGAAEPVLPE